MFIKINVHVYNFYIFKLMIQYFNIINGLIEQSFYVKQKHSSVCLFSPSDYSVQIKNSDVYEKKRAVFLLFLFLLTLDISIGM